MPFPQFKNKYAEPALFSPKDYFAYLKKSGKAIKSPPPEGVIFCYRGGLLKYVLENHRTKNVRAFSHLHTLNETKNRIAVKGMFGIGAPNVIPELEEYIEWGVKRFITIGLAGTLQPGIAIGDLVVCERAIRDEGTSHHYLKPSKYAYASPRLTKSIESSLYSLEQKYIRGTSWTTDAIYRETIAEAAKYRKEKVSTVEMEAAALFAVAQYRNVEMGAMFTVSDHLGESEWSPNYFHKRTKTGMEVIYKAAVMSLMNTP